MLLDALPKQPSINKLLLSLLSFGVLTSIIVSCQYLSRSSHPYPEPKSGNKMLRDMMKGLDSVVCAGITVPLHDIQDNIAFADVTHSSVSSIFLRLFNAFDLFYD